MFSAPSESISTRFLGSFSKGRDNNFTLIRFVAATAVLVTHSFILATGIADSEPFVRQIGLSLGTLAVHIFFAASGFLVTGSLLFRQSLRDFVAARALRIYPGLWVALIVTTLAVGCFFTALPFGTFIRSRQTWEYFARNGSLLAFGRTLPTAFMDVPWKGSVNGSLWTLPVEARMYAVLAAFWVIAKVIRVDAVKFLSRSCLVVCAVSVVADLVFVMTDHPNGFVTLTSMFFMGASLRIIQNRVRISHAFAIGAIVVLLVSAGINQTLLFGIFYRLTLPYVVLYLAFIPGGVIRRFNFFGDYSYGIYIYAFPVQQMVASVWHTIRPFELMTVSFLITLFLAVISWHFVESRALALKDRLIRQ